jgi:hypothetical protein
MRRMKVAILVGMITTALVVTLGCSSTASSGVEPSNGVDASRDDGGALGPNSSGIALARRTNFLIKENYDLRCKVCPCNGFSPGSDACLGAAFDQYPDTKRQVVCEIAAAERYGTCLRGAADCAAADQCEVVHQSEKGQCPVVQVDTTGFVPPPGCSNK